MRGLAQPLSDDLMRRETVHCHSLAFRIQPRGIRLALPAGRWTANRVPLSRMNDVVPRIGQESPS
ncbi:MAG: hypothetical protein AUH43_21425 [Acidobacteria bacterium 13_1_40CM_65_14]|nr:MAG: hypothetical protein AUH43_21425 [Acidobacteria bacterium 13_1_40CM_65_14]OLE81416.1 MAG: hypothetical protein AUF76_13045 [Acidobacteria bacterium 13_1_20CM_2_65_9]